MSGTRYPARAQLMAQQLYATGWKRAEIRRIMAQEGVDPLPALSTITMWVAPELGDRRRERGRKSSRVYRQRSATYTFPGRKKSPEWMLGRIKALHAAGVGANAIAVVMSHDFPEVPWTRFQVQTIVEDDGVPRPLRRLAA